MRKDPIRYTLKGLKKEDIGGQYYAYQLRKSPIKATDDAYWLIEPLPPGKKAKTRQTDEGREIYVTWLNYPKK